MADARDDRDGVLDSCAGWRADLLEVLGKLPPAGFERLCQQALRKCGFTRVEVVGRTGDGGMDGAGVLRVNLLSFHVLFQCKRWKGSVGAALCATSAAPWSGAPTRG